jgi:hypothetical protein
MDKTVNDIRIRHIRVQTRTRSNTLKVVCFLDRNDYYVEASDGHF